MSTALIALERAREYHLNHIKQGTRYALLGAGLLLGTLFEAGVHFLVEANAAEDVTTEGLAWNGVRAVMGLGGAGLAVGGIATRTSGTIGIEQVDAKIASLPEDSEETNDHTTYEADQQD